MAKQEPLVVYLYRRMGLREGTKAAAFIVAWGIYSDSLSGGSEPTMEGYERYWKESRATAYRELKVFREAFPGERFPDRVWSVVRASVESRKLAAATASAMTVVGSWA